MSKSNEKGLSSKEREELLSELSEERITGLSGRVTALSDTLHKRIDDCLTNNNTEHQYIREELHEIKEMVRDTLTHVKMTNGRVTELEKSKLIGRKELDDMSERVDKLDRHTKSVQFIHKYPKVSFALGLFLYIFAIKEIRDHIMRYIGDVFSMIKSIL